MDAAAMLDVAMEARKGLAEGGIPIGAALFGADGVLLGSGHNRRVQDDDPSVHAETDAFRAAGRQRDYRSTVMVTTLSPCWYCSGLVRQFNIGGRGDRGEPHVCGWARLAGRTRRVGHGPRRQTVRDNDG
jgi:cytosine deaminase